MKLWPSVSVPRDHFVATVSNPQLNHDTETGLYYSFARYYNSRLGRFMSADLLSGVTSDPQSLNRYAYVLNAPTIGTDPLGLSPTTCAKDKVNFINSNLAAVQPIADSLKVPVANILGLSYLESHNPKGGFEPQSTQFNNWFGVTASSLTPKSLPPYANGVTVVNSTDFYTFPGPGIQQSLNWFKSVYGSAITSAASPSTFAQNLVSNGYNSKNANYATLLANTIAGIQDTLKNCPDVKGNNGGGGGGGAVPQPGDGGLQWLPTITWTLCNWYSSDGVTWVNTGCFSWTYIL